MKYFLLLFICFFIVTTDTFADPVKVGAILPLSGPISSWGERVRVGLDTANELHGNKFQIVYEDEGTCEGRKALTAYRKLVGIDEVNIVFLGCLAGTEAIVPVAAKDPVLLLSLGLLNESTLSSKAKLVSLASEIGTESSYLAKYVANEEPKHVAGIFFADAFGQEFARILEQTLNKMGKMLVARDSADANFESFKSQILRWKQRKVDLLVTTVAEKQLVTLLREMKELDFHPKIFSTYILESLAPTPENKRLFEGIRYTHPFNKVQDSSKTKEVEAILAKKDKAGATKSINALFAYDGIELLVQGIEKCDGSDAACLYSYFTHLGKREGVSGEMRFEQDGSLNRPYGLKAVKNGEFVWLEKQPLVKNPD